MPGGCGRNAADGLRLNGRSKRLRFGKRRRCSRENPGCTVIGSDTMVVVDGRPLGKPKNAGDARRMLHLLSGRVHEVITGLAVLSPAGNQIGHRTTKVYFRALTGAEIDRYIATGEPLDKAGRLRHSGPWRDADHRN